jgi:hypothetical protein
MKILTTRKLYEVEKEETVGLLNMEKGIQISRKERTMIGIKTTVIQYKDTDT